LICGVCEASDIWPEFPCMVNGSKEEEPLSA
jgi:hypothetical protein